MPKKHFRKIIVFITLLMMFTALVIFNSPEYDNNYTTYTKEHGLVGRAADGGYDDIFGVESGSGGLISGVPDVDAELLSQPSKKDTPAATAVTIIQKNKLVTLSPSITYQYEGSTQTFIVDKKITGVPKGSGDSFIFVPQLKKEPYTVNNGVLTSTYASLPASESPMAGTSVSAPSLKDKAKYPVPNPAQPLDSNKFYELKPGVTYTTADGISFIPTQTMHGVLVKKGDDLILVQTDDDDPTTNGRIYSVTDEGLVQQNTALDDALGENSPLQALAAKPHSIDTQTLVLVEKALSEDRELTKDELQYISENTQYEPSDVPYDYADLFSTMPDSTMAEKPKLSTKPVQLAESKKELGVTPTGKTVYMQGGKACVGVSESSCLPVPSGANLVVFDGSQGEFVRYSPNGEQMDAEQKDLGPLFTGRFGRDSDFTYGDSYEDILVINGQYAINTGEITSEGKPIILLPSSSAQSDESNTQLAVYDAANDVSRPYVGTFKSGNDVIVSDGITTSFYKQTGQDDPLTGFPVVQDESDKMMTLYPLGTIASFSGKLPVAGVVGTIDEYEDGELVAVYDPVNVDGDEVVYSKSIPVSGSSTYDTQKDRFYDTEGQLVTNKVLSFNNRPWLFDSDGVPRFVEDVTPEGSATKVYASYDYSEGEAVVYGEDGLPVNGIEVKVKLLDGTTLTTTPTSGGVLVSDAAQKLMGTEPKTQPELPVSGPVVTQKPKIDMSITSEWVSTDAKGNGITPYQKVSFKDSQGNENQIAADVYNQHLVKIIDPTTTGKTGGYGGKLSNSQAALLYEFMSKDHPTDMNAKAVTCAGSVCHVGEDVYTVTTDTTGRDVVKVSHGVKSIDSKGDMNSLPKSQTLYSTAVGQLESSSILLENGVAVTYNPKLGDRIVSARLKYDDDTVRDIQLRYDKNTNKWIGIVDDQIVYVDSDGTVTSVGGKSCAQFDCDDVVEIIEPLTDTISAGEDKKLVQRAKSIGLSGKQEARAWGEETETSGVYIEQFRDKDGVVHYSVNVPGVKDKVQIDAKVYDEQLSKLKLDEKSMATLYAQMYKDKHDTDDIRFKNDYCFVDKGGAKEDAYYFGQKKDGTPVLIVYKDGDGEFGDFKPESFKEIVQYELDASGKPKKITTFEKVDGETVVTTLDVSNPNLKKKIYSQGVDDKQMNFEQIGDEWSSTVPVANLLDEDEREDLSAGLKEMENLQVVFDSKGKLLKVGGMVCGSGSAYQTDCDMIAEKLKPLSSRIAANQMQKTVELAGAQVVPEKFVMLAKPDKKWVAAAVVGDQTKGPADAVVPGLPNIVETVHGSYAVIPTANLAGDVPLGCTDCVAGYVNSKGVTIYVDSKGNAVGFQYPNKNFELYKPDDKGPQGLALETQLKAAKAKPAATGEGGGGVREKPVELTLKMAPLPSGSGGSGDKETSGPKKVVVVKPIDGVEVTETTTSDSKTQLKVIDKEGKTYAYDVYSLPKSNNQEIMLCYKDTYCYNKDGSRVDKNTGDFILGKDDSTVIGTLVTFEEKKEAAKPAEEKKVTTEEQKKAEEEKKAEDKKKAEEKKDFSKKESKPYTPPMNVAGLDANGNLASCADGTKKGECNLDDANFMFKHDSLVKGTEGYVYVTDEDKDVYTTKEGKACTPTGPTDANCVAHKSNSCSAQEAANPETGCHAVNCDKVKGCTQTSDGDVYCTSFEGKKSCVSDPGEIIENSIEGCKDNFNDPKCAGAKTKMTQLYNNLDFEFRSRVETVFGSLFDDWTGNMFNKMELWMYSGICGMDYYNTGKSEVDVIAGQSVTQEDNYAFNMDYLDESEVIVTLAGEKEAVTSDIFRYSFSLQTVGPVHGVVYLYNKCTKQMSFTASAAGGGWKDEFSVPKPLGVHRMHYAGEATTFDCNATAETGQECRFDHVCLKIMENEDYVEPICNKLGGEEIILNTKTGETDCGTLTYTGYD